MTRPHPCGDPGCTDDHDEPRRRRADRRNPRTVRVTATLPAPGADVLDPAAADALIGRSVRLDWQPRPGRVAVADRHPLGLATITDATPDHDGALTLTLDVSARAADLLTPDCQLSHLSLPVNALTAHPAPAERSRP